jgi:hypothetical protein
MLVKGKPAHSDGTFPVISFIITGIWWCEGSLVWNGVWKIAKEHWNETKGKIMEYKQKTESTIMCRLKRLKA